MKRGDAEKLLRASDWLTLAERALLSTLLQRANNITCEIEAKYAPHSRDELARWSGQSVKSVQRGLRHLEKHGWASVERGNGRGKGSRYVLVPRHPDMTCTCPKTKGDNVSPIRTAPKGDMVSQKGGHGVPERGTFGSGFVQVDPAFQARTARTEEGVPCDRCSATPSRIDNSGARYCATCAPHIWKDTAA